MSLLKYIKLSHYKVNGRTFPISFRADFKWRQLVLCNLLHDPKKGCGIQCVRNPVVPYIIVLRNILAFSKIWNIQKYHLPTFKKTQAYRQIF